VEGDPPDDEEGQHLDMVLACGPELGEGACQGLLQAWEAGIVGRQGVYVTEDGTLHGRVTERG